MIANVNEVVAHKLKAVRAARQVSQARLAQRVSELGVDGFHQTTVAHEVRMNARAERVGMNR